MKKSSAFFFIVFFIPSIVFSQIYTISGYIENQQTGERLIGANIYEKNTQTGESSNNFGFYSISFQANQKIELYVSYIGYKTQKFNYELTSNLEIKIMLEQSNEIEEINIVAENRNNRWNKVEVGTHQIDIEQIKMMPSLTGEKDIMKVYQLLPGVQSGREGTTGLYIRGGSPDQNLVLLDDIPLYYLNHLGGFFSVFDTDIIKSTKLIKGGFPARYGGRISSVIDIRMNDGNKHKMHKSISIGLLSTKLLIEGPLKKDRSSFIFSVRRSNIDLFAGLLYKIQNTNNTVNYNFYDIYSKFNHKFSEKNQFFFSFYTGNDKIKFNDVYEDNQVSYKRKDKIKWGNMLLSLRMNHKFNSKLYSNLTFAHTRFKYLTEFDFSTYNKSNNDLILNNFYSFSSSVNDYIIKIDSDYYPNNINKIKFGTSSFFHTFKPTISESKQVNETNGKNDTIIKADNIYAIENFIYCEDEIKLNKLFFFNIGIHFSSYHIKNQSFYSFQPRFISNIKIAKNTSVKFSYSRMTQYVHLLSNTGAGLPTDLWVPSTKKIKPQNSNLYSSSIVKYFKKREVEISVETFYKTFNNLITYKEGAILFGSSTDWQEKIETNGTGKSYGAEILINKKKGNTTGWISYYISKSQREFESINEGKPYLYKYDRRHDFSIVFNQKFGKRISLSIVWVYSTGNLMTLALSKYNLMNFDYFNNNQTMFIFDEAHIYNGKNTFRLPSYHRLDLGLNFTKQKSNGLGILSIGIYNVYNRKNPYYVFLKSENNSYKLYQQSLFPIIPSIGYSFKF